MKRLITFLGVVATVAAVPATVVAAPTLPSQRLVLDSYYSWHRAYTPPVSSSFKIAKGQYYVATVSGTFSYYAEWTWIHPLKHYAVCGTPDASPQYSGSLGGSGKVGFDAEFVYSRPWRAEKCAKAHFPSHWANFQMNVGTMWAHPSILAPVTVPTANHTYSYAVVGTGRAAEFRLSDVYTRDNYGLLKIELRPARASDCVGYAAFGFASQAACAAAI